jgi:ribosomal protein S18 acetylase RimI-like enzyme
VNVERVERVDEALAAAVARLVPQLSASRTPPTREEVAALVEQPGSTLFVAREDGEIVGMLTLVVYRLPTGLRARVEDVVVESGARGRGVGEALTRAALDLAVAEDVSTVELTSAPSREAANRLYPRLGFERRETNVYTWHPPHV